MRVVRTKRLDVIAQLDVRANPWDVWGTAELKRYTWWIAYDDEGRPAGFAGARVTAGGEGYLAWATVLPTQRGKGLQKRLIRARCAWLKKQGVKWAVTYTTHDNTPSMSNLIKCGFLPYEPAWPWEGKEYVYWRKKL